MFVYQAQPQMQHEEVNSLHLMSTLEVLGGKPQAAAGASIMVSQTVLTTLESLVGSPYNFKQDLKKNAGLTESCSLLITSYHDIETNRDLIAVAPLPKGAQYDFPTQKVMECRSDIKAVQYEVKSDGSLGHAEGVSLDAKTFSQSKGYDETRGKYSVEFAPTCRAYFDISKITPTP